MGVRVGRLTRRPEYLRVAAARRRAVTSTLILQMAEGWQGADAPSRIGFTASKKVGNAVHRNRARRRLKAAAAIILPAHAAAGRDYVAIARESTFEAPFARITADLAAALKKLGAWVEEAPPPPSESMGEGRGGGNARKASEVALQPPPSLPPPGGLPTGQAGGRPARGRDEKSSEGGRNCPGGPP